MANEELIELRNKLILGVSVALVITVPFLFFFITRYSNIKSKVYKAYRAEKTFVIYVTDSFFFLCSMVKNKLKNLDVEYIEYDLSKARDKDLVIKKIGVKESTLIAPSLVNVKPGVTLINLLNISSAEDVDGFISYMDTV
mgnify:CR=1 FL=1